MLDFLEIMTIITIIALIIIAYVIHLDQRVEFQRDCYNYRYTHLNALIDDFKAVSIFIVYVVAFLFAMRFLVNLIK